MITSSNYFKMERGVQPNFLADASEAQNIAGLTGLISDCKKKKGTVLKVDKFEVNSSVSSVVICSKTNLMKKK